MNEEDLTIDAYPTKELFIYFLIKDIPLTRAVIDLVDNSIDGAKRLRGEENFSELNIRLDMSPEQFKIADNCGGIPVEIAQKYAFRFGRPEESAPTPNSIGQFGVGMKRTLFKLGKKFRIESTSANAKFTMNVDIESWQRLKEWEFKFDEVQRFETEIPEEERQTIITVTSLDEVVADNFKLPNFITRVSKEIADAQQESMSRGLTITVNGIPLKYQPSELNESAIIKPVFRELIFREETNTPVRVKIYAGIVAKGNPSEAGWYILCNGRLVAKADQTIITGWGEGEETTIPKYNNAFARFKGFVYFDCDNAKFLPWNTTKTGVDVDSVLYKVVRSEMITIMRSVLDFLNAVANERGYETQPLEEAIEQSKPVKVSSITNTNLTLFVDQGVVRKNITPTKRTISYSKPNSEVETVRKALKVNSLREVGEKTFEYYLEECED